MKFLRHDTCSKWRCNEKKKKNSPLNDYLLLDNLGCTKEFFQVDMVDIMINNIELFKGALMICLP